IERGIDMFDCVHPTRAGRHGHAYTRFGVINLKNARHRDDPRPLDEESPNPNCRRFSRAYLHHLVKTEEILGAMILSQINLSYYQELCIGARAGMEAGKLSDCAETTRARWAQGDSPEHQGAGLMASNRKSLLNAMMKHRARLDGKPMRDLFA